jgi:hypothetical protein
MTQPKEDPALFSLCELLALEEERITLEEACRRREAEAAGTSHPTDEADTSSVREIGPEEIEDALWEAARQDRLARGSREDGATGPGADPPCLVMDYDDPAATNAAEDLHRRRLDADLEEDHQPYCASSCARLKARIAELEAENAGLRATIAARTAPGDETGPLEPQDPIEDMLREYQRAEDDVEAVRAMCSAVPDDMEELQDTCESEMARVLVRAALAHGTITSNLPAFIHKIATWRDAWRHALHAMQERALAAEGRVLRAASEARYEMAETGGALQEIEARLAGLEALLPFIGEVHGAESVPRRGPAWILYKHEGRWHVAKAPPSMAGANFPLASLSGALRAADVPEATCEAVARAESKEVAP